MLLLRGRLLTFRTGSTLRRDNSWIDEVLVTVYHVDGHIAEE
jgi:hypothetical protein